MSPRMFRGGVPREQRPWNGSSRRPTRDLERKGELEI
jgi:hypothetical protein